MSLAPYYQDSAVTIYHGDCREIVPQLGKFDLLLTDPPYGIGFASQPTMQQRAAGFRPQGWDASADHETVLRCVDSANKAIVWGGNYFLLPPSKSYLVWDKGASFKGRTFAECEMAWTSLGINAKIFQFNHLSDSASYQHPTQKPLELMTWCISLAGDSAKTILDPFAGSGTTGRAAKDLGRKATLIEREEKYCEIAAKRMAQEVFNL